MSSSTCAVMFGSRLTDSKMTGMSAESPSSQWLGVDMILIDNPTPPIRESTNKVDVTGTASESATGQRGMERIFRNKALRGQNISL